jgi:UPF0176 protein
MKPYLILLYYKFVAIDDPAAYTKEHLAFCKDLGLQGRILIAPEGINGTASGTREACEAYMAAMHADPRFADMVFKIDESDGHVFQKIFVRTKAELVTFRADHPHNPAEKTGTYLSPAEWHQMMQRDDVLIVDGRTDYEFDLGHFRKAIRPDVASFREFPTWIREHLGDNKDKPILTYCTGGIRCEKLSAWMLEEGFTSVYQLHGGIVTYGKDPEVKGDLWDGQCYVFDERVGVEINHTPDKRIVGTCRHCGAPTEVYYDCANVVCHRQFLACDSCVETYHECCSTECMDVIATVS